MVQFHILSFEGPDAYSRAGGIASRVTGLASALSELGFETHLWFIGDPHAPGYERRGNLWLHRFCQWVSAYHPAGVYDGEHGKQTDFAASVPPAVLEQLLPHLSDGGTGVVLAEEWQTMHAVLHLDWLLRGRNLRERVNMFWNANNTFGFWGIDWQRLAAAATITTVSRYMKHLMWGLGVDPLVIPNGIDANVLHRADRSAVGELQRRCYDRQFLVKMARWDPDKRWLLAVDTIAELKRRGEKPLLIARGGVEAHGNEVLLHAQNLGLKTQFRRLDGAGADGLMSALSDVGQTDILVLDSHVDPAARRILFQAADAVLANGGHEPFGLVGLETMAASGVACTGCSGEDYAIHGKNALVLQTENPDEFISLFGQLHNRPAAERELRRTARETAIDYAWPSVIERTLFPRLSEGARSFISAQRCARADSLDAEPIALKAPYNVADRLGSRITEIRQSMQAHVGKLSEVASSLSGFRLRMSPAYAKQWARSRP